ncbi:L-ribulose-5-phosphate 4-epimerase [Streptomyces sp. NPDC126514]|uniref:L-ribulose-5-phosphate 4-epimerase n=1 Tax=Streptomyces sp. NPDC126514 TaxID=3155210 RepID=UPI003330A97F
MATDLDGTIVRRDGTISARTVAAFAAVARAGATTVLVTGRPPAWTMDAARRLGHAGPAVCCHGAITYDIVQRRVLSERLIPSGTLHQVLERLRAAYPGIGFACEYADGLAYEPGYESTGHPQEVAGVPVADWAALAARPAAKLRARHPQLSADRMYVEAGALIGDLVTVTQSGNTRLLEACALGVDKAAALAAISVELGVSPEHAVAFGDMPNDLSMLAWAGRAYAVADAHPHVLDAVTGRCQPCEADGVAEVLERLFAPAPAVLPDPPGETPAVSVPSGTARPPLVELRRKVCAANRRLPELGLVAWTSGTVSAVDREHGLMAIKPSGVPYEDLTPEVMSIVTLDGVHCAGGPPSTETATHAYVYRNRPDTGAIVHTHSNYATSFAAHGRPIPVCLTEIADEFGQPIPCGDYAAIGDDATGRELCRVLGEGRAALMKHHGVYTTGADLDAALKSAVLVEDAAKTVWLAQAFGPVPALPEAEVLANHHRYTHRYGTPQASIFGPLSTPEEIRL